ncbi:MAG: lipoyl(octanoyl) transferase LipB, partial [Nitrospirales bacterium]
TMRRPGYLLNLAYISFQEAWDFQQAMHRKRVENLCPDTLLLVEHEPVFTMGRTTKEEHLKRNYDPKQEYEIAVYEIERGGSVTYHGPGQVVGYPIVRLRDYCPGPKSYVGMLQEVIIRVLSEWGIQGCLRKKLPGIWIEEGGNTDQKIAAIGVCIRRGVTMHGLSLNVNVDLKPFDFITPCGIEECQVTSMATLLGQHVNIPKVREQLAYHFAEVFGLDWNECRSTLPDLNSSSSPTPI